MRVTADRKSSNLASLQRQVNCKVILQRDTWSHRWRPESDIGYISGLPPWLKAQKFPTLISSGGVPPWLEHTGSLLLPLAAPPHVPHVPAASDAGCCKVPLSRKPSSIHCPTCWPHIIFSINRVMTICLLRVGSLCGRIGSTRKEMSNQTALSPSHMPRFYCFYPLFLWFPFCVIT